MAHVDSERSTETGTAGPGAPAPLRGAATPPAPDDDSTVSLPGNARPLRTVAGDSYVIESEAGRGGVGVVYRARDQRLGRVVAVKELQRDDPTARLRFEREMRITARLQHPGVVPVHEAGRWPSGEPFYAMKLVEGDSLKTCLAEARDLGERLALLPRLVAVAETMAYAHAHRITHRDLKPANVIVGAFGETVVIDWGLAKELDAPIGDDDALADTLVADPYRISQDAGTRVGTVVGTPAYMPPEQASGVPVDQRADVYALGAMLYHLLAGAAPYAGASSGEVLSQVLAGSPPPIHALAPDAPPELCAIAARAMARDPEARYPSATELADELRRFLAGQLVGVYRYSRRELAGRWLRRHRGVALTAALAALALVGVGVSAVAGVVGERDRADHERDVARAERRAAEASEARARATANQVILAHARGEVAHDPTLALAWLERLAGAPDAEVAARGRAIALAALAQPIASRVWKAWTAPPYQLVFAPDGGTLLAASASEAVVVLDVASGAERARWPVGTQPRSASASADGERVVVLEAPDRLAVVEPGSARRFQPPGCEGEVASAQLSPDGRWLACVRPGRVARLVDLDEGRVLDWSGSAAWPASTRLAFSADGTLVVAARGDEAALASLRIADGQAGRVVVAGGRAPIDGVVAAGAGRFVVAAHDGSLALVDARDGRVGWRAPAEAPGAAAVRLAASARGDVVAWHGQGDAVHVLDVATRAVRTLPVPCRGAGEPYVSPSGRQVAVSCADDARVVVWDLANDSAWTLAGHGGDGAIAWSADETRLATSGRSDGAVRLWPLPAAMPLLARHDDASFHALAAGPWVVSDGRAGDVVAVDATTLATRRFAVGEDMVYALAASADGRAIAAGNQDGTVALVRTDTGAERPVSGPGAAVWAVALDDTALRLAVARTDGAELWALGDGARVRIPLPGHTGEVRAIAFGRAAGEPLVATGGADGVVRTFALDGSPRRVLAGHAGAVQQVRFAGDDVISAGVDGTVRRFRPGDDTGLLLARHASYVRALVVSPSQRFVASAADDGTVWVSDLQAGRDLALPGGRGPVRALAWAADERSLYSASTSGSLWRWDLDGDRICALRAPAGVSGMALVRAGAALVTTATSGEVRLVSTAPVACLPAATAAWSAILATLTHAVAAEE